MELWNEYVTWKHSDTTVKEIDYLMTNDFNPEMLEI